MPGKSLHAAKQLDVLSWFVVSFYDVLSCSVVTF